MDCMDIDVTFSDFVKQSCLYKDIRRCYDQKNEYVAMCHEGIIRFTEEVESLLYDFSCYLSDMNIPNYGEAADRSAEFHQLMLWAAKMADTQFASSTLCHYLRDCEMEETQLFIASVYPSFYNHVHDSGSIFPSVSTALGMIK